MLMAVVTLPPNTSAGGPQVAPDDRPTFATSTVTDAEGTRPHAIAAAWRGWHVFPGLLATSAPPSTAGSNAPR